MKSLLYIFVLLFGFYSFGQGGKIILKKRGTDRVKTIKDSKKIRVKTKDGQVYYGNFTIKDDKSIQIEENVILLADIQKIKKKSSFGRYANPALIGIGSAATLGGLGYLVFGYGFDSPAILLPLSIPLLIVPATAGNHNAKNWDYFLVTE